MQKEIRRDDVKKIIIAAAVLGVLIFIGIKYAPYIMELIKNTEEFRDYVLSFGPLGGFIIVLFQFIQIIIPFIPGEIVQIAGGYIFGTLAGSLILFGATIIGTVAGFYISRLIGYPVVKIFVSDKTLKKFDFFANSEKIEILTFILFLIPGMPKDTLLYIAGLTPIKPLRFIVISMIGRIPGIIVSAFIGSSLLKQNFVSMIIATFVSLVIIGAGFLFRRVILNALNIKLSPLKKTDSV